jgi:hypothetical protein
MQFHILLTWHCSSICMLENKNPLVRGCMLVEHKCHAIDWPYNLCTKILVVIVEVQRLCHIIYKKLRYYLEYFSCLCMEHINFCMSAYDGITLLNVAYVVRVLLCRTLLKREALMFLKSSCWSVDVMIMVWMCNQRFQGLRCYFGKGSRRTGSGQGFLGFPVVISKDQRSMHKGNIKKNFVNRSSPGENIEQIRKIK